jgi:hypothetical protein
MVNNSEKYTCSKLVVRKEVYLRAVTITDLIDELNGDLISWYELNLS